MGDCRQCGDADNFMYYYTNSPPLLPLTGTVHHVTTYSEPEQTRMTIKKFQWHCVVSSEWPVAVPGLGGVARFLGSIPCVEISIWLQVEPTY